MNKNYACKDIKINLSIIQIENFSPLKEVNIFNILLRKRAPREDLKAIPANGDIRLKYCIEGRNHPPFRDIPIGFNKKS